MSTRPNFVSLSLPDEAQSGPGYNRSHGIFLLRPDRLSKSENCLRSQGRTVMTTAAINRNAVVRYRINRAMPANWRSLPEASALAVCCAKTICSGMLGTNKARASRARNTPYSAGPCSLSQQMHRPHQDAARNVGNHEPAAGPEETDSVIGLWRRRSVDALRNRSTLTASDTIGSRVLAQRTRQHRGNWIRMH